MFLNKLLFQGLFFRFKFMMIVTLLCAACTVIFFIMSEVSDGEVKWGDDIHLEYASAYLTGKRVPFLDFISINFVCR